MSGPLRGDFFDSHCRFGGFMGLLFHHCGSLIGRSSAAAEAEKNALVFWGVVFTKLRDDIVGSVCNSHIAPFSKMADTNTITHNDVNQNVKSMAYILCSEKNTHSHFLSYLRE